MKRDLFFVQMRDGTITLPLRQRLLKIENDLVIARIIEVEGFGETLDKLLAINADLQELQKDYADRFVTPGWSPSVWQTIGLWTRVNIQANWKGFVLGIIGGLLTSYMWDNRQDEFKFLESARCIMVQDSQSSRCAPPN